MALNQGLIQTQVGSKYTEGQNREKGKKAEEDDREARNPSIAASSKRTLTETESQTQGTSETMATKS
jgi:hypothetical protein